MKKLNTSVSNCCNSNTTRLPIAAVKAWTNKRVRMHENAKTNSYIYCGFRVGIKRKPHQKRAMDIIPNKSETGNRRLLNKSYTNCHGLRLTNNLASADAVTWLLNGCPWRSLEKVAKLIYSSHCLKIVDILKTLLGQTRDDNV